MKKDFILLFKSAQKGKITMLALKITDLKAFTNSLFIGDTFDRFWLTEASITTSSIFSIDGKLQEDFFDSDELSLLRQNHRTYALWKEIKPFCHSIVRSRHTPLHFKIVLQLSHNQIPSVLSSTQMDVIPETVKGLYLNLQYRNHELLCTTGTALSTFIPGKELDHLWDSMIENFFTQHNISFEKL